MSLPFFLGCTDSSHTLSGIRDDSSRASCTFLIGVQKLDSTTTKELPKGILFFKCAIHNIRIVYSILLGTHSVRCLFSLFISFSHSMSSSLAMDQVTNETTSTIYETDSIRSSSSNVDNQSTSVGGSSSSSSGSSVENMNNLIPTALKDDGSQFTANDFPFLLSESARLYRLAADLRGSLDYWPAISNYDRVLKMLPGYAPAWTAKGQCYEVIGETVLAVEAYQEALRLQPGDAEAHLNMAKLYVQANLIESAMEHFTKAIKYGKRPSTIVKDSCSGLSQILIDLKAASNSGLSVVDMERLEQQIKDLQRLQAENDTAARHDGHAEQQDIGSVVLSSSTSSAGEFSAHPRL